MIQLIYICKAVEFSAEFDVAELAQKMMQRELCLPPA